MDALVDNGAYSDSPERALEVVMPDCLDIRCMRRARAPHEPLRHEGNVPNAFNNLRRPIHNLFRYPNNLAIGTYSGSIACALPVVRGGGWFGGTGAWSEASTSGRPCGDGGGGAGTDTGPRRGTNVKSSLIYHMLADISCMAKPELAERTHAVECDLGTLAEDRKRNLNVNAPQTIVFPWYAPSKI